MKSTDERWREVVAGALVALCTLAVAWCTYEGQRWDGLQTYRYAEANALRTRASRDAIAAGLQAQIDVSIFGEYLAARERGSARLAKQLVRRFRPEARRAFDAWLATRPFESAEAPPGPFTMPEYRLASVVSAEKASAAADERVAEALECNQTSDNYVFLTVLLAMALFCAAVSGSFEAVSIRLTVLAGALIVFLGVLWFLVRLPIH